MDQAGIDTIPQTTTDQAPISITSLAARHAQLWGSPTVGVFDALRAEQDALDELMLHGVPTTPDENLTLLRLVWEETDDDNPLADALERVCEALECDGARNLRFHREESASE
jgi:hypothetical protein